MTRTQSKSAFRRVDAVIMVSGDNIVQDVNAIRVDRLLDLAHAIDFDFLIFQYIFSPCRMTEVVFHLVFNVLKY